MCPALCFDYCRVGYSLIDQSKFGAIRWNGMESALAPWSSSFLSPFTPPSSTADYPSPTNSLSTKTSRKNRHLGASGQVRCVQRDPVRPVVRGLFCGLSPRESMGDYDHGWTTVGGRNHGQLRSGHDPTLEAQLEMQDCAIIAAWDRDAHWPGM